VAALRDEARYAQAIDSIHINELDLNEIDESDLQCEKKGEQRISILKGIVTLSAQPKYRINFKRDESKMKCEFPTSIEIEIFETCENAEPSIKSTFRGIIIDLRSETKNAADSMRHNREPLSNEIDESDLQIEKHDEQRTCKLRRIVIDLRAEEENAQGSIRRSRESLSNEIDESDL
jgi:hypothetical protein